MTLTQKINKLNKLKISHLNIFNYYCDINMDINCINKIGDITFNTLEQNNVIPYNVENLNNKFIKSVNFNIYMSTYKIDINFLQHKINTIIEQLKRKLISKNIEIQFSLNSYDYNVLSIEELEELSDKEFNILYNNLKEELTFNNEI